MAGGTAEGAGEVTLICGGLVVDGTGSPSKVADVAICGSKIVAVGPHLSHKFPKPGKVIDAQGCVVTPGFVDIHTHYDGQVTFDPLLTPSTFHGVTTVVFGNCGVGFAPCRAADRGKLIDILVSVEDIPGTALHEGIRWSWETFPEYLASLRQLKTGADFAVMLGHVPLRLWVMGDRYNEEPRTEDLAAMRAIVAEAVQHGAAGFSTSRTLMHRDKDGIPIAGSYAGRAELTAIFSGLADAGGGLFEILEDFADVEREMAWIGQLSAAFGIPVSFAFGARSESDQRKLLSWMDRINSSNVMVTAQASVKTQGALQSLRSKYHPLVGHPLWMNTLSKMPYPEMIAEMSRPETKEKMLAEESIFKGAPFADVIFNPNNMFRLMEPSGAPRYERAREHESYAALAASAKRRPLELIYDDLVAGEVIWAPLGGSTHFESKLDLLKHPHVKIGLGDGGAHLGLFQEAGCPTYMLSHYVRDRSAGPKLSLELAVKMQTSETANVFGFTDRGVLAPGKKADVNVIDLAILELSKPEIVSDLPTGAQRWMQRAKGYRWTLVSGVPTFADGSPTGALTGGLAPHPFVGQLRVRTLEQIAPESIAGPEPRSTNDINDPTALVKDADLVGGGSAMRRAFDATRAAKITALGQFLSGEMLRWGNKETQSAKL